MATRIRNSTGMSTLDAFSMPSLTPPMMIIMLSTRKMAVYKMTSPVLTENVPTMPALPLKELSAYFVVQPPSTE